KAAIRSHTERGTGGTGIDCASSLRAVPGNERGPQLPGGNAASGSGRCRADVVVAAGRCEPGAVNCVRECGEPAIGAGDFARTRTRDARGAGSGAHPADTSRTDGKRCPGPLWRNTRSLDCGARCPAVRGVLAGDPAEGGRNPHWLASAGIWGL